MYTIENLRDNLKKRKRYLIPTAALLLFGILAGASSVPNTTNISANTVARQEAAERADRSARLSAVLAIDTPEQLQKEKEQSAQIKAEIEAEKKRLAEEKKKKEREERLRREKAEQERRNRELTGVPGLDPKRAKVVAYALAQKGKPYIWAASGPNGFDCSGLVLAAWRQVGVGMYHNAAVMWRTEVVHIKRSQLAPGDLVFYNGLGHVGMYIGNGKVIHAPQRGDVVRIASIDMMPPYGYGRPKM